MADIAFLDGGEPSPVPDIPTLFKQAAEHHPGIEAVVSVHQKPMKLPGIESDNGQSRLSWTYEQLHACSNSLATRLSCLGLCKGTSIAFFSDNCAEWALFCWSAVSLGCPFVPMNPASISNEDELQHMLQVTCPGVIVVQDEEMAASLEKTAPQEMSNCFLRVSLSSLRERYILEDKHPTRYQAGAQKGPGPDLLPNDAFTIGLLHLPDLWSAKPETVPYPRRTTKKSFNDTLLIGFTSGTTSLPKACPQSSANLQVTHAFSRMHGVPAGTRELQHAPAHHGLASLTCLLKWADAGTVVYPSGKFDAIASLNAIEKEQCHSMGAVPSMIKAFAMVPDISSRRLNSLRHVGLSGASVFPDTIRLCRDVLKIPSIGVTWGMTENPAPLINRLTENTDLSNDDFFPVGRPVPGMKIKICAPGTRVPLKKGEEGELHAGGPQVIRGYLNAENDTFYDDQEGHWIITGDMASVGDDGQVRILGRHKDMIIRGGVNIAPANIERRLNSIVGVDSQIVGISDEIAGEVPVAIIRLYRPEAENSKTTIATVQDFAFRELGKKLAPSHYIDLKEDLCLEKFPTTSSGKVKKLLLRKKVQDFLDQRAQRPQEMPDATRLSTDDILTGIWSLVSGIPREKFDAQTDISTYVDSITIMRFCGIVKSQLGKDISLVDVTRHPLVQQQARLLDSRSTGGPHVAQPKRYGPPKTEDMAHCNGDDQVAARTQDVAGPLLVKLGLTWERDVEDVMAAPDTLSLYLCGSRPQSWNQRAVFIARNTSHQELLNAWKATLYHHPAMRSLSVEYGESRRPLLIVLRDNEAWWRCSLHTNLAVNERKDLHNIFIDKWADPATGPLVRVAFGSIKSEPQNTAMIFVANHGVFDNMSANLFFEDLVTAIKKKLSPSDVASAPGRVPFKVFADSYHRLKGGDAARSSVSYHLERLSGIGSLESALWPPQRAPGWFKGADAGWRTVDRKPGDSTHRKPLDPPEDRCGLDGLTRTVNSPGLETLRQKHGIKPHAVLKAAIAVFNTHRTGYSTALFANLEAARYWPFASNKSDQDLPNPLDVAGPMFETVVNRIDMSNGEERVVDFLKRIQEDQSQLSPQSHAPLFEILRNLDAADAKVAREVLTRQMWNWPANIQAQGRAHARDENASSTVGTPSTEPTFEKFTRAAYDDVCLAWTCGLWGGEQFYLNASYDDCQLSRDEVFVILGEVLSAAAWLVAHPEGTVSQVGFRGDVGPLIPSVE